MKQDYPVPPPELIAKWTSSMCGYHEAARWGADQELEACAKWLGPRIGWATSADLRAARRPKPPSRKQRALDALVQLEEQHLSAELAAEIRRALEALPDD